MEKRNVFFVSLGCDKNLVDTEVMLGQLRDRGYQLVNDEEEAQVVVVNTCAFIHDAKEESIEAILEMAQLKGTGKCECLIATGCLTQRYQEELMEAIPELDGALGTTNYDRIMDTIDSVIDRNERFSAYADIHRTPEAYYRRVSDQTSSYAYLKISEGCDNRCTYCIIPSLRGRNRSRTIDSLVEEAAYLAGQGKNELIIVAQDTTQYGVDLYGKKALPELLQKLCGVEGIEWIRLLYCYPEGVSDELIETMAREEKILHYIDMPIQHYSNAVLGRMARKSNSSTIRGAIERLRKAMPDICIRSSLIVGFPGETEEEFEELKAFVGTYKLDRLGVFTYSLEEGTKAAEMDGQIDENIKEKRRDILMLIQQGISTEKNQAMVGKEIMCIVEGYLPEEDVHVARSYKDAPKVDGMVFLHAPYAMMSGQIVKATVTECTEYDLIGEVKDELS